MESPFKIRIKSMPIKRMRNQGVGDYYWDDKWLEVRVAEMEKEDYMFLVALHELIEGYLMLVKRNYPVRKIDEWDKNYKGGIPGDDPQCPYYNEHQLAIKIEKMVADFLKVDWNKYEQYLDKIEENASD